MRQVYQRDNFNEICKDSVDGDRGTLTAILLDDSIAEINKILDQPYFYLNNKSKIIYSAFDPNLNFIIKTLARRKN